MQAILPLPVAGLLSEGDADQVCRQLEGVNRAAHALGCPLDAPFGTLSFLALPVIPTLVQTEGINVQKMSPSTLMIVNLVSPDDRYDSTFLSNYATIYIKDELGRLDGVAAVTLLGQRDYSLRAWLDPDKLAALNLSAVDVVAAISQQNGRKHEEVPSG